MENIKKLSKDTSPKMIIPQSSVIIVGKFYAFFNSQSSSLIHACLTAKTIYYSYIHSPKSNFSLQLYHQVSLNGKLKTLKQKNGDIYGFKIAYHDSQFSMLFENQQIGKRWVSYLQRLMIMQGFYQDYQIIEKIGKGKSGDVFLAMRKKDNSKVAIKRFSKQTLTKEQKGMQALKSEVSILQKLNSQYIIKLLSVYQTENSFNLVLQYTKGKSLKYYIDNRELSLAQIKKITYMVSKGLDYLSKMGIAHRDIKPDNIMYDKQKMKAFIIDFGLATVPTQNKVIFDHCGTPGFVPPQTFNKNDRRILPIGDVYSLGITIHLMLFNKFPYKSTDPLKILQENKQAKFNFKSSQYSATNRDIFYLMKRMLSAHPESRITPSEVINHKVFQLEQIEGSWFTSLSSQLQSTKYSYSKIIPNPESQKLNDNQNSLGCFLNAFRNMIS